jgi:hypothetical protein
MTTFAASAGKTLLVGVAAGCAILACAPIASADPDTSPSPTPTSEQQSPAPSPPIPSPPKLPNSPNSGAPKTGDLADKDCWVIDGVPTWNAPGTAPRPIGPGQTAVPCYYVYGLKPH